MDPFERPMGRSLTEWIEHASIMGRVSPSKSLHSMRVNENSSPSAPEWFGYFVEVYLGLVYVQINIMGWYALKEI